MNMKEVFLTVILGMLGLSAAVAGTPIPETVYIPPGTFMMGCASSTGCMGDEKPVHRVTISKGFYMSKYETTWEQWDACVADGGCDNGPVNQADGSCDNDGDGGFGRGNRPVFNVSWNDAIAYAKWLSLKTGQRWSLPTEAQWEYAARAGSKTKYSWGNSIGKNKANCDGCGGRWNGSKTSPVGSFPANPFGLHDMQGNVWEWVFDGYGAYKRGAQTDPKGPHWFWISFRTVRGGSWVNYGRSLRSANRNSISPDDRSHSRGFRLMRQD
ncbi:MAG: formylglycine-generating enzyme family protein [Hyphomicrobiaceae bacterium]|nr:formylglycine-generating enzyme family protein [Hyphomicrobiaceae bacterium]